MPTITDALVRLRQIADAHAIQRRGFGVTNEEFTTFLRRTNLVGALLAQASPRVAGRPARLGHPPNPQSAISGETTRLPSIRDEVARVGTYHKRKIPLSLEGGLVKAPPGPPHRDIARAA